MSHRSTVFETVMLSIIGGMSCGIVLLVVIGLILL